MKALLPMVCLLLGAVDRPTEDLRGKIEEISRTAQGRVGAAVTVLETGESVAVRGDEHFPMQSVYKLPIGMTVLHAVDGGTLALDQKVAVKVTDFVPAPVHSPLRLYYPRGGEVSVRELLRLTVEESDGTASDALLRLAGGGEGVTRFLRSLGVADMVVATSEAEMARGEDVQYRNWASPLATIQLLRAIQEGQGLSPASRGLLRELMVANGTGTRWIKGLLPADTLLARKTGSSRTVGGLTRATNDMGIVRLPDAWHLAVAVFVADSKADEATREAVIARIARAAWDRWSGPPASHERKREPIDRRASAGSARRAGRTEAGMISILVLGLLLGMRHALEADHLAAVASLATRSRGVPGTVLQGAVWGLGHTLTLLLVGGVCLLLRAAISERLAAALEGAVGVMLLVLGADVLLRMRRRRIHLHVHRHDDGTVHLHAHGHAPEEAHDRDHHQHAHGEGFPLRALLVGMVHGLAGSAALLLVTLTTLSSAWLGVAYIAVFGVGSIAGMAVLAAVIALPLQGTARSLTGWYNGLEAAIGSGTLLVGAWVLYNTPWVRSLLS